MVTRFAPLLLLVLAVACGERQIVDLPALEGRARAGEAAACRELVGLLGRADQGLNDRAYAILIGLGPPAIPCLSAALDSRDRVQREYVIAGLGTLKAREAVPGIARVLADPVLERRYIAAWALGEIGDPAGIEPLVAALSDPQEEVRRYATRALIKFNRAALPPLLAFVAQAPPASPGLAPAIRALGDIGDPRALEPLLALTDGPQRGEVLLALGLLKDPRAEAVLIAALTDEPWRHRMNAAMALGPVGTPAALPALRRALEDEVVFVREWAARSLEMIGGEHVLYRNARGEMVPPYSIYH